MTMMMMMKLSRPYFTCGVHDRVLPYY